MGGDGFQAVWSITVEQVDAGGRNPIPSTELGPLLGRLYEAACSRPVDELRLERAIRELLEFLATDGGQTPDNFLVASRFLIPGDEYWDADWGDLPERFVEVLGIMAHELSLTLEDPEWAVTVGSTPSQLLAQLSDSAGSAAREK